MYKKTLIVLVAIILLIAGGVFFYTDLKKRAADEQRRNELNQSFETLNNLHYEKKYADSIAKANETLALLHETDPTYSALYGRTKGVLAWDTYFSGDREGGVRLFKEITDDTRLHARIRAIALLHIADFVSTTRDEKFARDVIFGKFFPEILEQEKGDINAAVRNLYEKSIELYPMSIPRLQVAYWYGQQLMRNKSLSAETHEYFLTNFKSNLEEGSALIVRDQAAEDFSVAPRQNAKARPLLIQAANSAILSLLDKSISEKEVTATFEKVFVFANENVGDPYVTELAYTARFHLASYLALLNPAAHASRIAELLTPIEDTIRSRQQTLIGSTMSNEYIALARNDPARIRYPDFHEILLLAETIPSFKSALEIVGWRF